ncbi:MAG: TolC family protein [Verrucomicrobiales bacterium]|nr:TolC family protein [Verrucomicrobiales bacterium]
MRRGFGVLIAWMGLGILTADGAETTLNLQAALRLAGANNLTIRMARERVTESQNELQQQREQFFPWVAPGVGYRRHDGNLQDVVGEVFEVSKQSGTVALALQAQVDLGETYYRVLAAKQEVAASEADAEARRRETCLSVALAYTELCRAVASVSAAEEAVGISRRTTQQVEEAVAAGLAFTGDAQRSTVQSGRAESELVEARLAARLASSRLARLLRLPPEQPLQPDLNEFLPVVVVAAQQPLDSLVAAALTRRPEIRRAEAVVSGVRARRDGAVKGPWWPTLGAQAGVGLLAGGPNDQFGNGDDFGDYSAGLSWRIGPGGMLDRARQRAAGARVRIAEMEADDLKDRVTGEVVELRSRAEFAVEQVAIAARNVTASRRLVELTQGRREFGIGAVLESVDAERELARARTEHLRAIANHNGCQWEFWYVIGQDDPGAPSVPSP